MSSFIDLTGKKFNRLTVISRNFEAQRQANCSSAFWNCLCDCGKSVVVDGRYIRNGKTKSCGCYNRDVISQTGQNNKKFNFYDIDSSDYGIGYMTNGKQFLFDKEDYEQIKDICWHCQKEYIVGLLNGKKVSMHRLVLGCCDNNLVIDHINGDKTDNRKSNLRVCTQHQNSMNRKLNSNNKSGYKGVSFNNQTHKWKARIKFNYQNIALGEFDKIEDAIAARIEAEKLYFGEYSRK